MIIVNLYTGYSLKVNVFISNYEKWEDVETFKSSTDELFHLVANLIERFKNQRKAFHHLEMSEDNCNIYFYEY